MLYELLLSCLSALTYACYACSFTVNLLKWPPVIQVWLDTARKMCSFCPSAMTWVLRSKTSFLSMLTLCLFLFILLFHTLFFRLFFLSISLYLLPLCQAFFNRYRYLATMGREYASISLSVSEWSCPRSLVLSVCTLSLSSGPHCSLLHTGVVYLNSHTYIFYKQCPLLQISHENGLLAETLAVYYKVHSLYWL